MALSALRGGMCAGQRETGGRVIELRSHPLHGVVADRAVLREAGGLVVRTIGRIEVVQVARQASRARQAEIVVDMALRALRGGMRASEGKTRGRMVELGSHPLDRVMAECAVLRECRGLVIRTASRIEIVQMAGDAGGAR